MQVVADFADGQLLWTRTPPLYSSLSLLSTVYYIIVEIMEPCTCSIFMLCARATRERFLNIPPNLHVTFRALLLLL